MTRLRMLAFLVFPLGLLAIPATSQVDCRGVWTKECGYAPTPQRDSGPPQPSAEERRRQFDAADLQEAAIDAQDRAGVAFRLGDVAAAVRLFEEAADYDPANGDIAQDLARARQRLTEINGLAARQAAAAARGQRDEVFDGTQRVSQARGIAVGAGPAVAGDPVVPPGRMTQAIRELERQRSARRARIAMIDRELPTLSRTTDSVRIVRLRGERDITQNQIYALNLEIDRALSAQPRPQAARRQ